MTKKVAASELSIGMLQKDPRFTLVGGVEKFVGFPPPGHRVDLWGILDLVAIGPGLTVGVQCTTKGQLAAHRRKILESPSTRLVLEAGWLIELHGWHKPKYRWECIIEHFQLPKEDTQDG
jgi:hypothetical protein